jgi:hypothetical protein
MLIKIGMQKTKKEFINVAKPELSSISVNEKGALMYSTRPWKMIVRQMVKDFPPMCWFMLAGMMMLFGRTFWAVLYQQQTVTHKLDILIYLFLLFVSGAVFVSIIATSYYLAKNKLKTE